MTIAKGARAGGSRPTALNRADGAGLTHRRGTVTVAASVRSLRLIEAVGADGWTDESSEGSSRDPPGAADHEGLLASDVM